MTNMMRGGSYDMESPTTIRIASDSIAEGTSLLAITYASDADGVHVPGFDGTLRIRPGRTSDEHLIGTVPEGIVVRILIMGLSGTGEIPIGHVGLPTLQVGNANLGVLTDATDKRLTIAGIVYARHGSQRFRLVDQGWSGGYESFLKITGFSFSIDEITAAIDHAEGVEEPETGKPPKRSSPARTRSETRIMNLLYKASGGGTSLRRIVIISASADRIRAREADGSQVKTFLIQGIIELCDAETGEDMLPTLRMTSDLYMQ